MPRNPKLTCQTTLHGYTIDYSGDLREAEVVLGSEVVRSFASNPPPGQKPTAVVEAIAWAKANKPETLVTEEKPKKKVKPETGE
jgi:hypothetical protein